MSILIARHGTMAGRGAVPNVYDAYMYVTSGSLGLQVSSWNDITFNTEVSDPQGYFTGAAPKRVTIPAGKAGDHFFTLKWGMNDGKTFRCMTEIRHFNSSDVLQSTARGPLGHGEDNSTLSVQRNMAVGDYILCFVFCNIGSSSMTGATLELVKL